MLSSLHPLCRTLGHVSPFPTYSHPSLPPLFLCLQGTWSHANSIYGNLIHTLEMYLRDRNMGYCHSTVPTKWQTKLAVSNCCTYLYLLQSPQGNMGETVKGWFETLSNSSNSVERCCILTKANNVDPFMHLNISTTKVQMVSSEQFSERNMPRLEAL